MMASSGQNAGKRVGESFGALSRSVLLSLAHLVREGRGDTRLASANPRCALNLRLQNCPHPISGICLATPLCLPSKCDRFLASVTNGQSRTYALYSSKFWISCWNIGRMYELVGNYSCMCELLLQAGRRSHTCGRYSNMKADSCWNKECMYDYGRMAKRAKSDKPQPVSPIPNCLV